MDSLPGWDERGRPAPPTYDDADLDPRAAEHLVAIHDMFRNGLDQVAEVVERVVAGRADVGEARSAVHALGLGEAYQVLGSWCGQVCRAVTSHHGVEDAWLYPPLREADPDLHAVLDRLSEEHLVIHDVLERVDARLVALARADDDGARAAAAEALATQFTHLHRILLSHFAYEEDAIGPALGVHRVMV